MPFVISGGGGGGDGGSEYIANAVQFDGTNDALNRDADLTGSVDNDTLLMSFWLDLRGGDGATLAVFGATSGRFIVRRLGTNIMRFGFKTAADVDVWAFSTVATYLAAGGWNHFLIAIDASASERLIYVNDAVESITAETLNAGDLDWTVADWAVGSAGGLSSPMNGDMADVYATNEFLDIGVEANRRKFIDGIGKPVDLGSDGSIPTGTAPLMFFSGPTDTWHTNDGSGEGFTETGALTDGASSPSD